MEDHGKWLLIPLVAIIGLLFFWWAEKAFRQWVVRRRTEQQFRASRRVTASPAPVVESAPTSTPVSTPASSSQSTSVFASGFTTLPPTLTVFNRSKERLRERKVLGEDLDISVNLIKDEFAAITVDEIMRTAIQLGYPLNDIADVMSKREYQAMEIAELLTTHLFTDGKELTVTELGTIIMSVAKSAGMMEKAEETFAVVRDTFQIDEDDKDLVQLPGNLGCSTEEAIGIVYRNTNILLSVTLLEFGVCGSPDMVARIATAEEVDLSKTDEYAGLRDGGLEFLEAAKILKACSKDAEEIIEAENEYDEFSADEDGVGDIFSVLSPIGFSMIQIMVGIDQADFISDNEDGTIVKVAFERGVPVGEIVSFLKSKDVDADTLDEELRDSDAEILVRIDLLHALLHADDGAAEKTSSDPESE